MLGDVQTALVEIFKQHHSKDLPPIFQDSDDYAQLQAYNLESVLLHWSTLDTRNGPLTPEEFKGSQPRLPPSQQWSGSTISESLLQPHLLHCRQRNSMSQLTVNQSPFGRIWHVGPINKTALVKNTNFWRQYTTLMATAKTVIAQVID